MRLTWYLGGEGKSIASVCVGVFGVRASALEGCSFLTFTFDNLKEFGKIEVSSKGLVDCVDLASFVWSN